MRLRGARVDGQESSAVDAAAQAPVASAPAASSPAQDDVAALKAEIAALRKEAASHRVRARDERTAAEKAAEEQGQFKALAEARAARVKELEALEPVAKRWQEHEQREVARIQALRESLDAHWQVALDAAPSLEGKQAILAAIDAAKGRAPPKPPVNGAAPGAPASTDWSSVMGDPTAFREAKARDPQGWAAHRAGLIGSAKPLTHFERLQQALRKTTA